MSYFHGLFAGTIEGLEQCPNTQSLDLSRNCLEDVENFEHCKNLWRLNLSDNKVCTIFEKILKLGLFLKTLKKFQLSCVRNLSKMFAIGTLDLSYNNLTWNELLRLRNVHILDLRLYGNEDLENVSHIFNKFLLLKNFKKRFHSSLSGHILPPSCYWLFASCVVSWRSTCYKCWKITSSAVFWRFSFIKASCGLLICLLVSRTAVFFLHNLTILLSKAKIDFVLIVEYTFFFYLFFCFSDSDVVKFS